MTRLMLTLWLYSLEFVDDRLMLTLWLYSLEFVMTRLMLTLWLYSLEFIDDKVDVDPVVVLTSVCRQPG